MDLKEMCINTTNWVDSAKDRDKAGFEPANLGSRGEDVTPTPPSPTWSYLVMGS